MSAAIALQSGLVVAAHGRHCLVESEDGSRRICHPRGKKSQAVVGDRVRWLAGAPGQSDEGTIEAVQPRRNLLHRQDEIRTKSFAANLDQVLVLVAAEPEMSESQLARVLIAAESEHIAPLIVLNKSDLAEPYARAWARLAPYRAMGYPVVGANLRVDRAAGLAPALQGKATLVMGPSGAGKSTLVNSLVPAAAALTQEISYALKSGKHTTTSTTWYWVDTARETALIDSPGFQEFGLHQIEPRQLAGLMPDIATHADQCRFYNCTHLHEPGCAVLAAVGEHASIAPRRHAIYRELFDELSQPPRY
ncbi:ribosome small subunit-dependent GTPase A [Pseudorhodoferax sp. Leaf267]|uniref:ribosome small subunit-dependent GTPase A n=1 Tax=Pseudorhodoferax sp. Leaf267 TaxID=1736316 RepID=UPI0006F2FD9F|nr:ribosome small subunit-dependent GTPase A [Pseudorhodoferax sp. Leaf267]KQP17947.1 GTPase RsgA [Pseudorhodoferax sp. Leaf267]